MILTSKPEIPRTDEGPQTNAKKRVRLRYLLLSAGGCARRAASEVA